MTAWSFGQRVQRDLIRIQLRQLEHKVQRQRAAGDDQGAAVTAGRKNAVKAVAMILFGHLPRRSPLSGTREW